eukprot:Ihof_evm17s11 gene=Ihof_evmTU17s11
MVVPSAMKLLVVGGNGFVGRSVCKAAVQRGLEVISLSRRGVAPLDAPWTKKVDWRKGDALDPESYHGLLQDTTAVVHTVGILLEGSNYKSYLRCGSREVKPTTTETYERANRDSALAVGREAEAGKSVKTFVYISAVGAPSIIERYITTKREAEAGLQAMKGFNTVILRPGFMIDEEDPIKQAIGLGIKAGTYLWNSNILRPFTRKFPD